MTDSKKEPKKSLKETAQEIKTKTNKTIKKTGKTIKKTGTAVGSFFSALVKAIVVLTICAFVLFFIWREVTRPNTFGASADNNPAVEPDPFPVEPSLTIVEVDSKLQAIGELATSKYTYTGITEEKNPRQFFDFDIPLTTNRVTVVYKGVIKVGYKISEIKTEVDNDKRIIYVTLPDPILISNEIDDDDLQYKEENNILNPLPGDKAATLLAKIKQDELKKAEEDGLYETAEQNAKAIVKEQLSVFADYTVQFR